MEQAGFFKEELTYPLRQIWPAGDVSCYFSIRYDTANPFGDTPVFRKGRPKGPTASTNLAVS